MMENKPEFDFTKSEYQPEEKEAPGKLLKYSMVGGKFFYPGMICWDSQNQNIGIVTKIIKEFDPIYPYKKTLTKIELTFKDGSRQIIRGSEIRPVYWHYKKVEGGELNDEYLIYHWNNQTYELGKRYKIGEDYTGPIVMINPKSDYVGVIINVRVKVKKGFIKRERMYSVHKDKISHY